MPSFRILFQRNALCPALSDSVHIDSSRSAGQRHQFIVQSILYEVDLFYICTVHNAKTKNVIILWLLIRKIRPNSLNFLCIDSFSKQVQFQLHLLGL